MPAIRAAVVICCAAAGLSLAPAAGAATFTAACSGSTGDVTSLITAITAANSSAGADTVELGAGCTYAVIAAHNNWYGPNGLPPIASDISVEGNGATILRDQMAATGSFRFFYVGADRDDYTSPGAGRLTLRNLTLAGGVARGGNSNGFGGGGAGLGGAIFNQGVLVVERSTLLQNVAFGGNSTSIGAGPGGAGMGTDSTGGFGGAAGGGMGAPPPGGFGGAMGGASSAAGGGGGAGFRTTQPGGNASTAPGPGGGPRTGLGGRGGLSTGAPGFGGDGSGGGGEGANGQPGGAFGAGGGGFLGGPNGGGGGGVGGGGGAGGGAGIADAGHGGGGGFGGGGGAGGNTNDTTPGAGAGGAGGSGGFGGGGGGGGHGGGAASEGDGGTAGFGGGSGQTDGPGGGGAGMGGAIFNMQGDVTIRASTLTENSATGGADNVPDNQLDPAQGLGGGVLNLSGTLEVVGSTLSGNVVSTKGSSIYNVVLDAVTGRQALTTLRSTIVADETGPIDLISAKPLATPEGPFNLGSATADIAGTNLVRTSAAEEEGTITGSAPNANPLLQELADNGGPTRTLLPSPDSPAIDGGSAFGLVTDQRGLPRPSDFPAIANAGDGSDIGAVERQAPLQPGGNGQPPPRIGSRVSARFRVRGSSTTVRRLRVARLPAGSKVVIRCARKRGRCPFKSRTRRYAQARRLARYEALFKRRRLPPRTVITVRVTKAGTVGLLVKYTTRRGKQPRRVTRCLPPGAARPSAC